MIQELIYTSHKGEGLKRGSGGGFCTVVCTQGMAPNIVRHLEQLSGYKHPFDVHDQMSSQNPVLWRFLPVTLGGVKYAALSRIADVKGDYSGRSNKLAHHVLITADEFLASGPAAILARSGVCADRWDGKVREVASRPGSAIEAKPFSGPCKAWKSVAGDAGWAGVIAERLTRRGAEGFVRVIFPVGMNCLALVDEVFSLLPVASRWQTGFSTYVADSASDCKFEFLLDGTREAAVLRKDPRKFVVDLCKPLPAPSPSAYVNAARSGDLSKLHATAKKAPRQRQLEVPPAAVGHQQTEVGEVDYQQTGDGLEGELQRVPPELSSADAFGLEDPALAFDGISQHAGAQRKSKKKNWVPLLIVAAVAALMLCGGLVYLIATDVLKPAQGVAHVDDPPIEDVQSETLEVGGNGVTFSGGEDAKNDPAKENDDRSEGVEASEVRLDTETSEGADDVEDVSEVESADAVDSGKPPKPVNSFKVVEGIQIPVPDFAAQPVVLATFPANRKLNLSLSKTFFESITDPRFAFKVKAQNQAWEFSIEGDAVADLMVRTSDGGVGVGELVFQWSEGASDYYQEDPVGNGLFFVRFLELVLELEGEEARSLSLSPLDRSNFNSEDMADLVAGVYHHFDNVRVEFRLRKPTNGWKKEKRDFHKTLPVSLSIPKEGKGKNGKRKVKLPKIEVPIDLELRYEVRDMQLRRNKVHLAPPYKKNEKGGWAVVYEGEKWGEVKTSLSKHPAQFQKRGLIKTHNGRFGEIKEKQQKEVDQSGAPVDCVFYIGQKGGRRNLLIISDGLQKGEK